MRGLDRLIMLLSGKTSIRGCYCFSNHEKFGLKLKFKSK